jgi:hypothetical protein
MLVVFQIIPRPGEKGDERISVGGGIGGSLKKIGSYVNLACKRKESFVSGSEK